MKLFLLRHATALETWPDAERKLSDFGKKQIEKLAQSVDKNVFDDVVQIWHSPFVRAESTASIFKDAADIPAQLVPIASIVPDGNPYEIARTIASLSCFDKDLLVVSHNPLLENLADVLLSGTKRGGRTVFKKCTLASFTLEEPPTPDTEFGLWSLDFLISPSYLSD